jgi:hypothetical protein
VFKAQSAIDLGRYAVVLGVRYLQTGNLVPIRDTMFWFGSGTVQPQDWVFLFTGSGQPRSTPNAEGNGQLHLVYWGKEHTVFHDPTTEPMIWRLDGLGLPTVPLALPQSALGA